MLNMEENKADITKREVRLLKRLNKNFDKVFSDEVKEDFLQLIATGYTKTGACVVLKISAGCITMAREQDEDFDRAWLQAQEEQADLIEQTALERALNGIEKPQWFQGERVGEDTVYDNNLLITMLKAAKPEKYKDRKEVTGAGGGAIELTMIDYTGGNNAHIKADKGQGDEEAIPRPEEPGLLGDVGSDGPEAVGPDIPVQADEET